MSKLKVFYVSSDELKPNPHNANRMSDSNRQKLKLSIDRLGAFKPVVVRELDGGYEVLGGWHRALAMQELGVDIPVLNLGKITDQKAREITLIDNTRYGQDDPEQFKALLDSLDTSIDELSTFVPGYLDALSFNLSSDIDLDSLGLDESGNEQDQPTEPESRTLTLKLPIYQYDEIVQWLNSIVSHQSNGTRSEQLGNALYVLYSQNRSL